MKRRERSAGASALACEVCGMLPHPRKVRLTLANVAAVLPIELLVHAAVVNAALPYGAKVLVLALAATVLVIWVAEPSARRALREWLHAPSLAHRRRLHASQALWRVRTFVRDGPGERARLERGVATAGAEVLALRTHPVPGGVLGELVVAAPPDVTHADLVSAADAAGGGGARAWPVTALALADGPTGALELAVRVAGNPDELQLAVAELLGAVPCTDPPPSGIRAGTVLKIPAPWHGSLAFTRAGEPFTSAESARAHRLAELAELSVLARGTPVPVG